MMRWLERSLTQATAHAAPSQQAAAAVPLQGEMINESGTMSGGGGKPRGGRMCLGNAAPRTLDTQAATAELAQAEQELGASQQVDHCALAAFI